MITIECFDPADDTTCITLIVELGVIGRHGWEAMAWTFEQAASASGTVALVSPTGAHRAIPIDFVDTEAFARKIGAGSVRSYLTLVPHWSIGWIHALSPWLKSHSVHVSTVSCAIHRVARWTGLPTDQLRLAVLRSDGHHETSVVLCARDQSRFTGFLAAETALKLATSRTAAGVLHMSDLLTLQELESTFKTLGATYLYIDSKSSATTGTLPGGL